MKRDGLSMPARVEDQIAAELARHRSGRPLPRKKRGMGLEAARRLRRRVFKRDGGKCASCGVVAKWEADHIQPRARGGRLHCLGNVQTLCHPCHDRKTARDFPGWKKPKRKTGPNPKK